MQIRVFSSRMKSYYPIKLVLTLEVCLIGSLLKHGLSMTL
jgi:hypothetical protein